MEPSLIRELQYFGASVLYGVGMLLCYDVLRIWRNVIKHKWFVIAIEDILYWAIASVLVFQMVYIRNDGRIRFYSLFAMVSGMLLYHTVVEDRIVNTLSKIILFLLKPLRTGVRKIKKFSTKIEKKWSHLLKSWKKTATIAIKKP